jgi:RHS repeat-associated protein
LKQTDNADQLVNVSRNNNLLTVAGSLSNSVTSLTINGQPATLYHDLTWAVPGGITVTSGQNQLTAVVTTGGLTQTTSVLQTLPATVALRYDADGNLTWDGLLAYTYDGADELTAVTLTNGWKTGYVYDGLGRRRIRRDYTWTNSAWAETNKVHYVYDGMSVIQERNSNNVPLVTYTRGVDLSGTRQGAGGIGGLLARTDTNSTACYHTDGNGNVTALVNGSGAVVAKYLYDSFGNTLGMWGSLAAGNTYRFSSKEMDARTGQYYYGYRWYDPNLQRWLNRDPIQELGGINLYGFVGNGPVNEIDPFGFWGVEVGNNSGTSHIGIGSGNPNLYISPDAFTTGWVQSWQNWGNYLFGSPAQNPNAIPSAETLSDDALESTGKVPSTPPASSSSQSSSSSQTCTTSSSNSPGPVITLAVQDLQPQNFTFQQDYFSQPALFLPRSWRGKGIFAIYIRGRGWIYPFMSHSSFFTPYPGFTEHFSPF